MPEWLILQFATARIGVVLVNINPAYRTSELKYALRQSDVRGLALIDKYKSSHYFDMINEACPELAATAPGELQSETFPKLKWVVSLRGGTPAGMLSWAELLAKGEECRSNGWMMLRRSSVRTIRSTSSTRRARPAFPRARCSTHRNILLNAFYAGDRQRLDREGSRLRAGAVLSLLRLRAGDAGVRGSRRGDGVPGREF